MSRVQIGIGGLTFDIPFEEAILRVKIDRFGIAFWRRSSNNLDRPRALDKTIEISWKKIGEAGTCYIGSRDGRHERGPAVARVGLHWLTHKKK